MLVCISEKQFSERDFFALGLLLVRRILVGHTYCDQAVETIFAGLYEQKLLITPLTEMLLILGYICSRPFTQLRKSNSFLYWIGHLTLAVETT